tara:strand:- start:3081 stop:3272 length:192 start_codon:yes stop_codon:yes gene_type:complete
MTHKIISGKAKRLEQHGFKIERLECGKTVVFDPLDNEQGFRLEDESYDRAVSESHDHLLADLH